MLCRSVRTLNSCHMWVRHGVRTPVGGPLTSARQFLGGLRKAIYPIHTWRFYWENHLYVEALIGKSARHEVLMGKSAIHLPNYQIMLTLEYQTPSVLIGAIRYHLLDIYYCFILFLGNPSWNMIVLWECLKIGDQKEAGVPTYEWIIFWKLISFPNWKHVPV